MIFKMTIVMRQLLSVGGELKQTYSSERSDPPGELGYCPRCGEPLNIENDGGNGFCINCAGDCD